MRAPWLLALAAFVALAADSANINGKWTGPIGGGDAVFTLKTDGSKIGGSMTNAEGKEFPITKGELHGDAISFTVASEWQGNAVTLVAKGTVKGEEIDLTLGTEGGEWSTELVLKRAK